MNIKNEYCIAFALGYVPEISIISECSSMIGIEDILEPSVHQWYGGLRPGTYVEPKGLADFSLIYYDEVEGNLHTPQLLIFSVLGYSSTSTSPAIR